VFSQPKSRDVGLGHSKIYNRQTMHDHLRILVCIES